MHPSGAKPSFFESALRHRIYNPGESVDSAAVLALLHRRTEIYLGKSCVLFADIVHDKKTVSDESNILRKTAPFQDICSCPVAVLHLLRLDKFFHIFEIR